VRRSDHHVGYRDRPSCGGLGVRTWLAIHYAPDWRWFLKREDSPWYPTMRLFRQSQPGDWKGVFARLSEAVRAEMAHTGALAPAADARVNASLRSAFFVPTSPGELLDKFSILQIKSERLTNAAQIRNVKNEIGLLEQQRDRLLAGSVSLNDFVEQLKKVNETLWQVEEDLRSCERARTLGRASSNWPAPFTSTTIAARPSSAKINLSLASPLTEEKTYAHPCDT